MLLPGFVSTPHSKHTLIFPKFALIGSQNGAEVGVLQLVRQGGRGATRKDCHAIREASGTQPGGPGRNSGLIGSRHSVMSTPGARGI